MLAKNPTLRLNEARLGPEVTRQIMLRGERPIHPSDLVLPKPPLAASIVRRLRRDTPLALLDASIVFAAYLVALVLRFDGRVPHLYWRHF